MERVQKEQASRDAANAGHVAQGKTVQIPAQTEAASRIDNSPRIVAQAKLLQGMFGDAAQLQEAEEEPLQGKFAAVQMKGERPGFLSTYNSNSFIAQRYQYINSSPPSTKDSIIYGIYNMTSGTLGNCIYVGQTIGDRAGTRFIEHVKNDSDMPWYGKDYSSNDSDDWPYVPLTLEALKDVTKFEVTAAEQWWIEDKSKTTTLKNKINAMTKDTFNQYKVITNNYDYNKISVSATWKPSA
jgi:hypothetical protein